MSYYVYLRAKIRQFGRIWNNRRVVFFLRRLYFTGFCRREAIFPAFSFYISVRLPTFEAVLMPEGVGG